MEAVSAHLEALNQHVHPDGGWGYAPGQPAQLEPTCFAMLALSLEADIYKASLEKALGFLAKCAAANGTYHLAAGRPEATWPTSLVLFTLAQQKEASRFGDTLRATSAYLLNVRGKVPDSTESGELHDIDLKLVGWPWAENNFSWVEPTAWACLALRQIGLDAHPRVQEGVSMLLDRAMDEGGINYGNRRILGRLLDPIPGPTALMLLALQEGARGERRGASEESEAASKSRVHSHPRIAAACRYLLSQRDCGDLDNLCWMKLALDLHRDVAGVSEALPALDDAIRAAHENRALTNWTRPAPLLLALTALALATEQQNVFRLPRASEKAISAPQLSSPRRTDGVGQRFGSWFRGVAIKAAGSLRQFPQFSAVHIAQADSYETTIVDILQAQFEHFRERVPLKGKRVVLKPNLVEYHRDKVINTHPRVVGAVIELCKREGAAEVIVAEGPGHWRNVEYLVTRERPGRRA